MKEESRKLKYSQASPPSLLPFHPYLLEMRHERVPHIGIIFQPVRDAETRVGVGPCRAENGERVLRVPESMHCSQRDELEGEEGKVGGREEK